MTLELAASLPALPSVCAYDEFYAFTEPPFGLTPNTRFVFWGGSLSLALEQIMLAMRAREGVVVVTGDTGTGKTMLCRALASHLRPYTMLSMVVNPTLGADDLLKQILLDFGVSGGEQRIGETNNELFRVLEEFLVTRISQGDRAVLIIDEAQHLQPQVFEQIRLLSNLESEDAKLLQVVLVGHPDLESVLRRPEQRGFDQRVSRRCELRALTPEDVRRYVDHRLTVAQAFSANTLADPTPVPQVLMSGETSDRLPGRPVEFTPTAIAAIATLSQGVPRVINLLCDRALEVGHGRESRSIDRELVRIAAGKLRLRHPVTRRLPSGRTAALAAASLIVVAVGATGWRLAQGPRQAPAAAPAASQPIAAPAASHPAGVPAAVLSTVAVPSSAAVRPTVAVPPATSRGAREAGRGVMLAVASFRTEERAAEVVERLQKRGLTAFARPDASGEWHQVLIGPYASAKDARAARRRLAGLRISGSPLVLTGTAPAPALMRREAPAPSTPTAPDAGVLDRARGLAQKPDVPALLQLRADVVAGEPSSRLQPADVKRLLDEVDRYTDDARRLQLQRDGLVVRKVEYDAYSKAVGPIVVEFERLKPVLAAVTNARGAGPLSGVDQHLQMLVRVDGELRKVAVPRELAATHDSLRVAIALAAELLRRPGAHAREDAAEVAALIDRVRAELERARPADRPPE